MQDRLRRGELDRDPLGQFDRWHREVLAAGGPGHPQAMILATASAEGQPSARMVLLKDHGPEGFVFYTNHESRKGRELEANPRAALLFYWSGGPRARQVRIEGRVERTSQRESERHFRARPFESRVASAVGGQSEVVENLPHLLERFEELSRMFAAAGEEVPLPAWAGCYRLLPDCYEFWQEAPHRLHDRFRYRRAGQTWMLERLYP